VNLHAADLADRLQRLPPEEGRALLSQLPPDKSAAVLAEVEPENAH
jgi:flagellar motility protein MotE (MotC chaperone)